MPHRLASVDDTPPLSPALSFTVNSVSPVHTGCVFTELPAPEVVLGHSSGQAYAPAQLNVLVGMRTNISYLQVLWRQPSP